MSESDASNDKGIWLCILRLDQCRKKEQVSERSSFMADWWEERDNRVHKWVQGTNGCIEWTYAKYELAK